MKLGIVFASTAALAIALITLPKTAQAYGLTGAGGMIGYATPQDLDGTASVSVHAELENRGTHVHLVPNMMYWNVNGVRDVAPNMDVYYHFRPEGQWTPYVGGGLGVNFIHERIAERSNADLGMNVIGGLRFPGAANRYFLEGRYTASDINQVSLRTGVTFMNPR
jgi:opacity protein-like surface antigen